MVHKLFFVTETLWFVLFGKELQTNLSLGHIPTKAREQRYITSYDYITKVVKLQLLTHPYMAYTIFIITICNIHMSHLPFFIN